MVRMILALFIGIALSGNSAFGQVSVTVLPPASVGASVDINISKLNQGIYSVKVTTGSVSLIQKLTIVR